METILENRHGSIKIVKFNKPQRKNAIDPDMYVRITKILNDAAVDDEIYVVVLTGMGDYYSSGNDLKTTIAAVSSDKRDVRANILNEFIHAFITFPKLLVAVVNGPAIGIAATTLALCDLVFASETSFFYTPFSKLGFVAEGSSTYTFPRLIGDRKAAEMLLFNHKMSATEASNCGFVNYVYKHEELQNKAWDKIVEISELPQQSILATKKLMRRKRELIKANEAEIEELRKLWTTDEYLNTILKFVNKKSKV